jgi:hypothetical protein
MFNRDGKNIQYGFFDISDWLDSVIASFPAPWIIGDDTRYGTEIFDSRGIKVLSVWMAWGNPSERQRRGMSDEEWSEYCCDSHWESETQWHISNAIVCARNYLKAHKDNGWYGEDDRQREILRTLITAYGRWEEGVDREIACGGPDRRMTSAEAEETPELAHHKQMRSKSYDKWREEERTKILERLKSAQPTLAINPEAKEAVARRRALTRAIGRMIEERPAQPLEFLPNGLRIDSFTMMDRPYLERLVEVAKEEYENDPANHKQNAGG